MRRRRMASRGIRQNGNCEQPQNAQVLHRKLLSTRRRSPDCSKFQQPFISLTQPNPQLACGLGIAGSIDGLVKHKEFTLKRETRLTIDDICCDDYLQPSVVFTRPSTHFPSGVCRSPMHGDDGLQHAVAFGETHTSARHVACQIVSNRGWLCLEGARNYTHRYLAVSCLKS